MGYFRQAALDTLTNRISQQSDRQTYLSPIAHGDRLAINNPCLLRTPAHGKALNSI
ncbi:MAG: hypothetical protein WBM44_13530 [Waterburya sp.]